MSMEPLPHRGSTFLHSVNMRGGERWPCQLEPRNGPHVFLPADREPSPLPACLPSAVPATRPLRAG
jgi:hypothetical protein